MASAIVVDPNKPRCPATHGKLQCLREAGHGGRHATVTPEIVAAGALAWLVEWGIDEQPAPYGWDGAPSTPAGTIDWDRWDRDRGRESGHSPPQNSQPPPDGEPPVE